MVRLAVAEREEGGWREEKGPPGWLPGCLMLEERERISAYHATHRQEEQPRAGDRARQVVHPLSQDRKLRSKPYQGQRKVSECTYIC